MLTVTRIKQVNANSVYANMIDGVSVEAQNVTSNDVVLA